MKKNSPIASILAILILCCMTQAEAKPLKVFILSGQSNMQGLGGVRTFEHIGMNPQTAPMLKDMQDSEGNPLVLDEVYITYLSGSGGTRNGKGQELELSEKSGKLTVGFGAQEDKIGPEYTFGIYMHKALNEPILIIKTAWGGRSLNRDFRPPSSIPEELSLKNLEKASDEKTRISIKETGRFYRIMMDHVQKVLADPGKYHPAYDPKEGYEIAGFVWFQGFNDKVDSKTYPQRKHKGGYDLYTELMAQMIRDIRKELDAPELPFVVGVIGMDGPSTAETEAAKSERYRGIIPNFRAAQAAVADIPEFKNTVTAVHTDQFWDHELGELDARMVKINQKLRAVQKEGSMSRKEQNELREKLIAEAFNEEELRIHKLGRSAQSYHYLGSAKMYGQFGMAFANAMLEMTR